MCFNYTVTSLRYEFFIICVLDFIRLKNPQNLPTAYMCV